MSRLFSNLRGYDILVADGEGNIYAGTQLTDSSGMIVQNGGVLKSSDKGQTWITIDSGLTDNNIVSLSISASGYLFAGSEFYGLFRSIRPMTSGVLESGTIPPSCILAQNSPNPFAQTTNISFTLNEPSFITLKLFNPLGSEVAALANGFFGAGEHAITFDRGDLPDGVYFYRLEAGGESLTRSFAVMR